MIVKMNASRLFGCILLSGFVQCFEKCDIHATITRHVENEGFHSEIHSLVEIILRQPLLWAECTVALEEVMSSGLYVNPDQLADLRRLEQSWACTETPVDVESSEQNSSAHFVYVYSSMHQIQNLLSAKVVLPFHLRYHNPMPDGGYAKIQLNAPVLLLNCGTEVPCMENNTKVTAPCGPCKQEKCDWYELPYKTNSPSITLQVPVGNLSHYLFVTLSTLFVTCGACLYILTILNKMCYNQQV